MNELNALLETLTLDECKELLLRLAGEIFSVLNEDEKRSFVVRMIGQTGKDKIGSMVQL